MRNTAIFRDDLFLQHIPGFGHVESPERLAVLYEPLDQQRAQENFLFPAVIAATPEILALNHTAGYLRQLAATAGRSFTSLDPDTMASPRSYEAACLAAGAMITGIDMILAHQADNGFALVRPPGHHAEADRAMGFCLLNNIAIAAHYLLRQPGIARVLVVDWDLHHGNGTQHAFYDTDQVLYFSTHQYPHYPGTGALLEVGSGRGEGYTINVPLPGGQGDRAYATIFNSLLAPVARAYRPDFILLSAGFDISAHDPLGGMQVSTTGFGSLTQVMVDLAGELCDNRLLLTLEGGYSLPCLRDGVLTVLDTLKGHPVFGKPLSAETHRQLLPPDPTVPMLNQAINIAKKYWTV